MKKFICGICFLSLLLFIGTAGADTACCIAPDNGTGTADLPPAGCAYDGMKSIIDGLPPGTTIEVHELLVDFWNIVRNPGGPLGGETENFSAKEVMYMTGTGGLDGYARTLFMQAQCEVHTGPRNPGDPVQSFPTDFFMLQGQLPPGDPDFDLLRITAGTAFLMPSPGHTTLTQLPSGDWNVDSFFDIEYRIDFIGAPGGPLAGMSGSTTGTTRMMTGCGQPNPSWAENCGEVKPGNASIGFGVEWPPIPADFFDPGSVPFAKNVLLGGGPGGWSVPDTIVRRGADPFDRCELPGCDYQECTIPIELVALSLRSIEPITVEFLDGRQTQWDVQVGVSNFVPGIQGSMTIRKTHCNGGTYSAILPVQAKFVFTQVDNPFNTRVLDTGQEGWPPLYLQNNTPDHPWVDNAKSICNEDGFFPVGTVVLQQGSSVLGLTPPGETSPFFAVDSKGHFDDAIADGRITPMEEPGAMDYMNQRQQYHIEGPPPDPSAQSRRADLSPYIGNNAYNDEAVGCLRLVEPMNSGMTMKWGGGNEPEGSSLISMWTYNYPSDPDLSNVTITVTVLPPSWISSVSFGMRDIFGNIRSWDWNVGPAAGPGMLQWGVPTTININPPLWGTTAATPAAISFANNPAFDITQVSQLIFDENGIWVASELVPPPGETVPRMWNYWYDLAVTPTHSIKTTDPIKWSQPVVEYCPELGQCCPGEFKGWDEISLRDYPPLLADDWECKDDRPITDIHWWGSFVGWMDTELPALRPIAFHFGIWTDTPKVPCQINSFSHPNTLVWEHYCYDYEWNFAGYDKDPRPPATPGMTDYTYSAGVLTLASAATSLSVVQPTIYDSCFQFYQKLPEWAWFYQEPGPCSCCRRVYWLSISAIYPYGMKPYYPWGWKTRPHYYNDDAVRIYKVTDPWQNNHWPPQVDDSWSDGVPLKYPACTSWDLAFELTTNRECDQPGPFSADINKDGMVNLGDFAIMASQWLTQGP